MAMSRYCLASWRDVFGEIYVGLKRLGVIHALKALGEIPIFFTRAEGYRKEHLIRILVGHPNLYLSTLDRALYLPLFGG